MTCQSETKTSGDVVLLTRLPLHELGIGESKVLRIEGLQIAVFRTGEKEVFAIDNQCPHEGYPLSKGPVVDCVLTCPWHNYKFQLQDGKCIKGEEAVQTYPVRIEGGQIVIEQAKMPIEQEVENYLGSFHEAMTERRVGQAARDALRLLKLGVTAERLLLEIVKFDAHYAEYGTTHTLAVACDLIPYLERYKGVRSLYPLMQVAELAIEDGHRRKARKVPPDFAVELDLEAIGPTLIQLIEDEKLAEAEGLVRGAISRGVGRYEMEQWLYLAVAQHFIGFGHALIYQVKLFDLLDECGWDFAPDIVPAFVVRIINWTREDLLPHWRWFRENLALVEPQFIEWEKTERNPVSKELWDGDIFLSDLVCGDRLNAFRGLTQALELGVPLIEIVDILSEAASERMLRFDVEIDSKNDIQNGWLSVTHIVTYVNALRSALSRFDRPEIFRLFYFAVRFVNQGKALDRKNLNLCYDSVGSFVSDYQVKLSDIEQVIADKQPEMALRLVSEYRNQGGDIHALEYWCQDLVFKDLLVRPIVVGHWVKLTRALFEEYRSSARENRFRSILALIYLGASPLRERWLGRLVSEAIEFIEHGKTPKDLM